MKELPAQALERANEVESGKPESAMTESTQPALRNLLQAWIEERHQALQEGLRERLWEQMRTALEESRGLLEPETGLLERLEAAATPPPVPPPPDPDADLGAGLDLIADAQSQGEVLKRMLDGVVRFAGRGALYVLKQGIASLYAQRGFEACEPRLGVPVVPPPELEELIQGPSGKAGHSLAGPACLALLGPLGSGPAPDTRIIALHLRRKSVALLLADSGEAGQVRCPNQLRALVLGAEARLAALAVARDEERSGGAETHPSMATQRIPDPIAETVPATLDPTVRSNAERSARVLVGDIELYFPAKVVQGQHLGNLYAAMKDELDRSRASFVERYGAELESHHHIFYKTVVQQLCAGDPSRLGPAPWANS
jgi:hypothetical protein